MQQRNKLAGTVVPPVQALSPPPSTPEKQDVYRQNFKPSVDILWVVDNSQSMGEEQVLVSTNFPVFMDYFLGSNLDYHIGVVSTDMADASQSGKLVEKNGVRWIDPETEYPSEMFAAMSMLGTGGSGSEEGILAAYAALELQTEHNEGFFRDDSAIHLITVSDEPDLSPDAPVTLEEFAEYLNDLRPTDEEVTYNTIVNPRAPDRCNGLIGTGTRYITVNEIIGGVNWSVCDDNWAAILEMLGLQTAGLKREYFLSELPVAGSVVVTVEDVEGVSFEFTELDPQSGEGDWTYDNVRNSVTFTEYLPTEGATVYIDYLILSAMEAE
ncbi:MAG: hypothetical protein H0V89_01575 [Deltaproteobacteria bacterium]|nr:hypothetical protein [Deltaproteobacteria bacterium]